jgi:hypothetical protein
VTALGGLSFHEAFLAARERIARGEDPELLVPELLAVAEADEEIELAESLYGDEPEGHRGDG